MSNKKFNVKNGISYIQSGDYYIPDFDIGENKPIGRYGRLHLKYIKEYRKSLYSSLLISGKLNQYLAEIDTKAQIKIEKLIKALAVKQGITEKLKVENQMEWVGRMNNIKHSAEEIVLKEFIYS